METNTSNTAAPSVEVPRLVLPLAVTYRELHEDAAGMGIDDSFFAVSKIDPNAAVKCNCDWDEGHHANCDIVAANRILMSRQNDQTQQPHRA
jgi:hypothetical protein